jgi:hypothetical protein
MQGTGFPGLDPMVRPTMPLPRTSSSNSDDNDDDEGNMPATMCSSCDENLQTDHVYVCGTCKASMCDVHECINGHVCMMSNA